jgi:hypothetical protein
LIGVARVFLVQHTKIGQSIANDHKIYQRAKEREILFSHFEQGCQTFVGTACQNGEFSIYAIVNIPLKLTIHLSDYILTKKLICVWNLDL